MDRCAKVAGTFLGITPVDARRGTPAAAKKHVGAKRETR
jgi:hypothetical protein